MPSPRATSIAAPIPPGAHGAFIRCPRIRGFARVILALCLTVLSIPSIAAETSVPGPCKAIEITGIHNAFRIDENLLSGSSPDTEESFRALAALGVKLIVSVDGAKPNVMLAKKFGIRYVHLPIGYDGVPAKRGPEFAKALIEADGAVYFHCHHGKHRGPAAAAATCRAVKGWSAEKAEQFLQQAGTSPDYNGLFRDVHAFRPLTETDLKSLSATLPETSHTPGLVDAMVTIDEHFDALKAAQTKGWETPAASERATLLWENYRELLRDAETAKHGDGFLAEMRKAEGLASNLKNALSDPRASRESRDAAMKAAAQNCTSCHKAHRN